MQPNNFDLAVLLATRGRCEPLMTSLRSLVDLADHPENIEIMLAFDRDDTVSTEYFRTTVEPWLQDRDMAYTAMMFDPLGYINLHVYNNHMAKNSQAAWFVIWNDDAVMQTQGWDTEILRHRDEFLLLAFHTHNDHPYSIFPIVPRKWYDLLGYISPHQAQDAWVSQQAYLLDIWHRIPVHVHHDRFDLTGNNLDETFRNRQVREGNPSDPLDFHSTEQTAIRHKDCFKLASYLKTVLNQDMTFFENIFQGRQDPWEKLAKNDVNGQMMQFANPNMLTAKHVK